MTVVRRMQMNVILFEEVDDRLQRVNVKDVESSEEVQTTISLDDIFPNCIAEAHFRGCIYMAVTNLVKERTLRLMLFAAANNTLIDIDDASRATLKFGSVSALEQLLPTWWVVSSHYLRRRMFRLNQKFRQQNLFNTPKSRNTCC